MKNYRWMFPIVLSALFVVSIYSLVSGATEKEKQVQKLIQVAESYSEQELYDKATKIYNEIIAQDEQVSHFLKVIDMYYQAKDYLKSEEWCEKTLKKYPKEVSVYERMLNIYLKQENYKEAYKTLEEVNGRQLDSEVINNVKKELEYKYDVKPIFYELVVQPSEGLAGAKEEENWGIITSQGKRKVKFAMSKVGYYANDIIAVCDKSGQWFLINSAGEYTYNVSKSLKGKVTDIGIFNEGLIPICVNGKYAFYNLDFEKKSGDYDYAGSFNGGVAAVKNADKWSLINTKGEKIVNDTFRNVVLDERGLCCINKRIFVQTEDEDYRLIDNTGASVGSETFDGARAFSKDNYAAIMRDEQWGFVDVEGNIVIEPEYQEAKSFALGMAAVCDDNLWGYVNVENQEVIEKQYIMCTTFSKEGTTFVQNENGRWNMISLYKYNH